MQNKTQPYAKRFTAKHSMKRRCEGFDYRSRHIYMITLTIEGRRQILGKLCGNPLLPNGSQGCATLVPSPLGEAIIEAWKEIPAHQPEIKNIALQLMPDHIHFIIFVTRQLPIKRPLGTVIAVFKARCLQRYKGLIAQGIAPAIPSYILKEQEAAKQEKRSPKLGQLFEAGINDKILWRDGELQAWRQYLADNPRRRLLKEQNPMLFKVKHGITTGGFSFEAMGNEFLLDYPRRLYVQCSRKMTEEDVNAMTERLNDDFANGTVFVSACISPGEKTIMRSAFSYGCPVVVLRENGFGQYEKPGGKAFDACVEGRLLLLAPWRHHNERIAITRNQCLQLNSMAEALCTDRAR